MKVVINASPLIFLSKLNMLHLLKMYQTFTTEEVIDEVLMGVERGYKDALAIKRTIEKNEIEVIKFKGDVAEYNYLGLHRGELTVIIAAKRIKAEKIIIDDYSAIKVARYFDLKPLSTPFVLLNALKEGLIDKRQFRSALDRLISYNYWISPTLYTKLRKLCDKM